MADKRMIAVFHYDNGRCGSEPYKYEEIKRGEWVEDEGQNVLLKNFIDKGEVWRVCSVCGAGHMIGAKYETDKYYHRCFSNFCPNCGADMREREGE